MEDDEIDKIKDQAVHTQPVPEVDEIPVHPAVDNWQTWKQLKANTVEGMGSTFSKTGTTVTPLLPSSAVMSPSPSPVARTQSLPVKSSSSLTSLPGPTWTLSRDGDESRMSQELKLITVKDEEPDIIDMTDDEEDEDSPGPLQIKIEPVVQEPEISDITDEANVGTSKIKIEPVVKNEPDILETMAQDYDLGVLNDPDQEDFDIPVDVQTSFEEFERSHHTVQERFNKMAQIEGKELRKFRQLIRFTAESRSFPLLQLCPKFHTIAYQLLPSKEYLQFNPRGETELQPYPKTFCSQWAPDIVPLPCCVENERVVVKVMNYSRTSSFGLTQEPKQVKTEERFGLWNYICQTLSQTICSCNDLNNRINRITNSRQDFNVLRYTIEEVMSADEGYNFFAQVLPFMVKLCLELPNVLTCSIPLLKRYKSHNISLTQHQIASLLANAFFCTFPKRLENDNNYPSINFNDLYFCDPTDSRMAAMAHKLRCILHYFERLSNQDEFHNGVVSFSRKSYFSANCPDWNNSKKLLKKMVVLCNGTIETEGAGMLQVDFANKYVGGGVLGRGAVQEEILFVIYPELLISRLFTEKLFSGEALIITGCERFSNYCGYSASFNFAGNFQDETPFELKGRRQSQIVAIDALFIHKNLTQFNPRFMERELNKAFVGFTYPVRYTVTPVAIASGKWGCGAFNGNPELKAILQLLAASEVGRDLVIFVFGDDELQEALVTMYELLKEKTVGEIWACLKQYYSVFCAQNELDDRPLGYTLTQYFTECALAMKLEDDDDTDSPSCSNSNSGDPAHVSSDPGPNSSDPDSTTGNPAPVSSDMVPTTSNPASTSSDTAPATSNPAPNYSDMAPTTSKSAPNSSDKAGTPLKLNDNGIVSPKRSNSNSGHMALNSSSTAHTSDGQAAPTASDMAPSTSNSASNYSDMAPTSSDSASAPNTPLPPNFGNTAGTSLKLGDDNADSRQFSNPNSGHVVLNSGDTAHKMANKVPATNPSDTIPASSDPVPSAKASTLLTMSHDDTDSPPCLNLKSIESAPVLIKPAQNSGDPAPSSSDPPPVTSDSDADTISINASSPEIVELPTSPAEKEYTVIEIDDNDAPRSPDSNDSDYIPPPRQPRPPDQPLSLAELYSAEPIIDPPSKIGVIDWKNISKAKECMMFGCVVSNPFDPIVRKRREQRLLEFAKSDSDDEGNTEIAGGQIPGGQIPEGQGSIPKVVEQDYETVFSSPSKGVYRLPKRFTPKRKHPTSSSQVQPPAPVRPRLLDLDMTQNVGDNVITLD